MKCHACDCQSDQFPELEFYSDGARYVEEWDDAVEGLEVDAYLVDLNELPRRKRYTTVYVCPECGTLKVEV